MVKLGIVLMLIQIIDISGISLYGIGWDVTCHTEQGFS